LFILLYLNISIDNLVKPFDILSSQSRILSLLFQTGIWLSTAWLINRLISVFIWEGLVFKKTGKQIPKLLKDLVVVVIFFIVLLGIMSTVFGYSLTGFWATSGIVGIVLGFALQNIILDTFTGIAINLDKPYKIGDWITIHSDKNPELNIYGCLVEISWRTTRIRTRDDNLVIIPNRMLGQLIVTNYTSNLPTRQTLIITLDFSIPPDRALRTLTAGTKAALGKNNSLAEPPPKTMVYNTNTSGIEYLIWFWIRGDVSFELARHFVVKSIMEHLQQAGIIIAYPKQHLYYAEMPISHIDDSIEERVAILNRIPLFNILNAEEINHFAANLQKLLYKEGETIVKQGDLGDTMFIIVEGLLDVFNDLHESTHKVKVAQMIGGQFFGEMSLLTGQARSATVIAATDTMLYAISTDIISPLIKKKPDLAKQFSKIVAERSLRTSKAMEDLVNEEKTEITQKLTNNIFDKFKIYFESR
jgi:small-conductance mechanosensitive channel/CRP-like cAMP-binding protein